MTIGLEMPFTLLPDTDGQRNITVVADKTALSVLEDAATLSPHRLVLESVTAGDLLTLAKAYLAERGYGLP